MNFEQQLALIKTLLDCHKSKPISEEHMPSVISLLKQTVGGHTRTHVHKFTILLEAMNEFGFGGDKYYEDKYY